MQQEIQLRAMAHPPNGLLLIDKPVIEKISAFLQSHPDSKEAGGILLGFRRENHLHISDATTPQSTDSRWRFFFKREKKYRQEYATQQWKNSGGVLDYIGEWHTHPEINPTPSPHDMKEWNKLCGKYSEPLVFVIAGLSGVLWIGSGSNNSPVRQSSII